MAAWSPRPLLLLLLLALLCSHIALCSSAAPAAKPKPKASAGRKALLASDADDGDEPVKAPKTTAAGGKAKKKLVPDGKNQTKVVAKGKKSEPAAAAKPTKKTSAKAGGDLAVAKPKVPKVDKAATAKSKATDSAAKSTKVQPKTGAAKASKQVKSEGGAPKAKKPSNSTVDASSSKKPAKSTKKTPVLAAADGKASAKATNTTVSKESAGVEEDVVFADEADGTEDLMSEFRGLPARLHETLMPDLARLSHTSKAYMSAANAGIAGGVRPILGGRWAAAAASAASVALLLLPLFMLTALVRRMGPYLPLLHRALLLSQAYLAIYFATLALLAAATGLEPLRFFHATSPAAYAWTQSAQSLGFMGYLVLQMVDLVAVFSGAASPEADTNGDATKALGLAQMVVGLAVGLHYYAAVFHRAAAGEAPRANWRVYAVYAACFVIICACARAEKRKKAYLAGGDGAAEEWKKS
ncbi:uncharacterized protein LOC104583710 [Brachypodium distachyon]|uniref:Uncharacterized protein n=1 Tax=Brachypodium distachyon TaxID=15368 RepID=I1I6Y9_BRADI|nr:uncharacterized protein LOC104583710 [Brachypodium distachyon]KQJ98238.1 hypothetical protein BRADI_3g35640v3 [Brachypodium distachyon]|eukprot:XP_010235115.1 uncharacterized protein LOC104583710 [Brachypodium distachyon]